MGHDFDLNEVISCSGNKKAGVGPFLDFESAGPSTSNVTEGPHGVLRTCGNANQIRKIEFATACLIQ